MPSWVESLLNDQVAPTRYMIAGAQDGNPCISEAQAALLSWTRGVAALNQPTAVETKLYGDKQV